MKFTFFVVLVIGAALVALVVGWRRAASSSIANDSRGWVAHSGYISTLPGFKRLVRRSRIMLAGAIVFLSLGIVGVAFSAGAPIDRVIQDEKTASRDIVLCLDTSGSMIPYDGNIGDAFSRIVQHFAGERISLNLWNSRTLVKFPLTNDYDLAVSELDEMSRIMKEGYLGESADGVYVTQELIDYTSATVDDAEEAASLAGDGLASCVLSFDHSGEDRSRLILFATDNEINGPQIYTLAQAFDFAHQQNVQVTTLYPGDGDLLTTEGEELKELTEDNGGVFYDASDAASVQGIIQEIESLQRIELSEHAKALEIDKPAGVLSLAAVGIIGFLGLLAIGRL